MCRRTEEEVGPTVGLPRHRHFVGFFNVPVLAPTRDQPFYTGDSDTPPHLVAFYDNAGDTEVHILDLTPGPSRGPRCSTKPDHDIAQAKINENGSISWNQHKI